VIVVPGPLDPPAPRLLAALPARGGPRAVSPAALPAGGESVTLALSTGPFVLDLAALAARIARPFRILVLSRLGAHPDARAESLRRLWRIEEHARRIGAPVLTLRFAPLLAADAPLWSRLRRRPALPRGGRAVVQPALEADAVETLLRALDGRAAWSGWYEVAGAEPRSLAELRDLADAAGPAPDRGAWEPPLAEMAEHRLAEPGPWTAWCGVAPRGVASLVREAVA